LLIFAAILFFEKLEDLCISVLSVDGKENLILSVFGWMKEVKNIGDVPIAEAMKSLKLKRKKSYDKQNYSQCAGELICYYS
jgi:hypothetical protein